MKQSGIIAVAATIVALTLGLSATAARDKELGVINYFAKYEYPNEIKKQKALEKDSQTFFAEIEKLGQKPEWVDTDVFLAANQTQRDSYKRLLIPAAANWFTKEMYDGMLDYVRNGGLLITQSALLLLDNDGSYRCGGTATTAMCRKTFLGVTANGGAEKPEIKVLVDNPLTRGLKVGEWLKADRVSGRFVAEGSAKTAVIAKQTNKKGDSEGPLVTWKSTGKGACVFIACAFHPKDPALVTLMKNALSEETREWLIVE